MGLLLLGWPETNSDESTIGLMALHILQGREQPVFFYGQNYMGSGEAWLAAGLFGLFGPSLVALRLPLLAIYAAFLVVAWHLGELLSGRGAALAGTLLLALGSTEVLTEQLRAGSRVELLLAGSCMAWLSAWLVMRGQLAEPWRQGAAAAGWGLAAGHGLWTDLLTAPWVLATGTDCWTCHRLVFESREWTSEWSVSGGDWGPAFSLGGVAVDGVDVAVRPESATVYVQGSDSRPWDKTLTYPNTQSGWSTPGGSVRFGTGAAAMLLAENTA
ncbi:MAG: hypothetical protein DLM67_10470 [Candidatus Nephthysia bennettiae]|nr:MAG: hypothetical protein DLM67_10470 [Candidatus Dormibacteraeota bacterium]